MLNKKNRNQRMKKKNLKNRSRKQKRIDPDTLEKQNELAEQIAEQNYLAARS